MRTLSCLSISPCAAIPATMSVPRTGMMTSFPMAREMMAPRGRECHWPLRGRGRRARALPRQMRPSGTDAAPMNWDASRMNERGGRLSGALGMWEEGSWRKRALRVGMRAIGKAMRMEREGGLRRERINVRAAWRVRRGTGELDSGRTVSFSLVGDGSASVSCFSVSGCLRLEKENDLRISEESTSGPTKSRAMSLYPPHGNKERVNMRMKGEMYAMERLGSVLLLNGAKLVRLRSTDVGISPTLAHPPAASRPYLNRCGTQKICLVTQAMLIPMIS